MSIETSCPNCQKAYKFADTAAGRRAKCRGCGAQFPVPQPEPRFDWEGDSGATAFHGATAFRPAATPAYVPPKPAATSQPKVNLAHSLAVATIIKTVAVVGCLSVVVAFVFFVINIIPSTPATKTQIAFGGNIGNHKWTTKEWLALVRKQDQSGARSTGGVIRKAQLQGIENFIIADPAAAIDLFDAVGEPSVRGQLTRVAEAALGRFEKSKDQPSVDDIKYGLNHDLIKANYWALKLLQHQEADVSACLERVRALSKLDDKQLKTEAIAALGHLRDLPSVLEFLDDPNYELKAIDAIGAMGDGGCDAAGRLVEKLPDAKYPLRIVESLGRLGPCALPARDPLMKRIAECKSRDRDAYAKSIVSIDPNIASAAIGMLAEESGDSQLAGVAILMQLQRTRTDFLSSMLDAAEKMNSHQRSNALTIIDACGKRAVSHGKRLVGWYDRFPEDAGRLSRSMFAVFPDMKDIPDEAIGKILASMSTSNDEANRVVAEAARRSEAGTSMADAVAGLQSYVALLTPKLAEVEAASAKWQPIQFIHFKKRGVTKKISYSAGLAQFGDTYIKPIRRRHEAEGWEFVRVDPPASNPHEPQIGPLKTAVEQAQKVIAAK